MVTQSILTGYTLSTAIIYQRTDAMASMMSTMTMDLCPLCDRVLGHANVSEHHLIPKTFKGKITVRLHNICHRKIHATFTERELLHDFHTIEALRGHELIQAFVKWVSKKEPSYYDGTKSSNRKRGR